MIWPAAVIGFLSNYMITPSCSCPAIVVRLSPACKLRFTLHLSLSPLQSQRHWAALSWLEVSLHAAGHWSVLIIICSRPRLWPQAGQQAAGPLLGPSVRCPVFTYPHHAMLTIDQALTFRSHTLHTASNSQGRGPRREGATSMQNIFLRCISFLTTSNLS